MNQTTLEHTAEGLDAAADFTEKVAALLPDGRLAIGLLGAAELTKLAAKWMASTGQPLSKLLEQITPINPIVLPWQKDPQP